jgi:hypothetical protein
VPDFHAQGLLYYKKNRGPNDFAAACGQLLTRHTAVTDRTPGAGAEIAAQKNFTQEPDFEWTGSGERRARGLQ